jgi:hypothetical protein
MFYFSLGILILTQGASLLLKPQRRFLVIKLIFITAIILVLVWSVFLSWQQYKIWASQEFTLIFIRFNYFFGYIFINFFLKSLIAFVAALIFLIAAFWLNKKFQERFFEKEEPYLGALAIFLVGQPWWMYYIIIIGFIGVIGTLFLILKPKTYNLKPNYRFPFYYFWLPIAIIFIVIKIFLV